MIGCGGRKPILVHKHLLRNAPTWILVLLFPAMHEHQPVKIVQSMSQSTHLLWKSEFFFNWTGATFFFNFKNNFIFDGEWRIFPTENLKQS